MSRSLSLDIFPRLVRWMWLYPKIMNIIAAPYDDGWMNRNVIQGIEQFKVVGVLAKLCKLVMRPPNQFTAIKPTSRD